MEEKEKKEIIVDGKRIPVPEGQVSGMETGKNKKKEKKEMPLWFLIFLFVVFASGFFTVTSDSTIIVLSQFALFFGSLIFAGIKWGSDLPASRNHNHVWDHFDTFHTDLDTDTHGSIFSDSSFSSLSSDDMSDRWPSSSWDDWHHDVVKDPAYAGSLNIWD